MKKYLFTVITILSLLFVLVGCSTSTTGDNKNSGSSGSEISAQLNKDGRSQISAEQAEQAALTHAGVTVAEARFKRTELELDDGVYKYDVEFYVGTTEYDYEIDANTGSILSFDKDID